MIFHNETSKHQNNKQEFHSQPSTVSISLPSNRVDLILLALVVYGWMVYICSSIVVEDLIPDKSGNMKIIIPTLVLALINKNIKNVFHCLFTSFLLLPQLHITQSLSTSIHFNPIQSEYLNQLRRICVMCSVYSTLYGRIKCCTVHALLFWPAVMCWYRWELEYSL